MLKMCYFLKKAVKFAPALRALPQILVDLTELGARPYALRCCLPPDITFWKRVSSVNAFYYCQNKDKNNNGKCSALDFFALFYLVFTSNSVVFIGEGVKIFFAGIENLVIPLLWRAIFGTTSIFDFRPGLGV